MLVLKGTKNYVHNFIICECGASCNSVKVLKIDGWKIWSLKFIQEKLNLKFFNLSTWNEARLWQELFDCEFGWTEKVQCKWNWSV